MAIGSFKDALAGNLMKSPPAAGASKRKLSHITGLKSRVSIWVKHQRGIAGVIPNMKGTTQSERYGGDVSDVASVAKGVIRTRDRLKMAIEEVWC
jgi:hypothetical protein